MWGAGAEGPGPYRVRLVDLVLVPPPRFTP